MPEYIPEAPEQPQAQAGTEEGYGRMPLGLEMEDWKEKAKTEGGFAWDEHARAWWLLFGRAVKIEEYEHSIEEGFRIVNFNFHAKSGNAVPTPDDAPGSVEGFNTPGIGGKRLFEGV